MPIIAASMSGRISFNSSYVYAGKEREASNTIPDIDAAIIGMDVYDEKVFQAAPRLKCVCKFGVGVDVLPEPLTD